MKYSEVYKGNFIEAADVIGKPDGVKLTIKSIAAPGTVKSEDGRLIEKPIVSFEKTERGLILNVTNARRIMLSTGKDMDDWAGSEITLITEMDKRPDWQGQKGPCVRVKLEPRKIAALKPTVSR